MGVYYDAGGGKFMVRLHLEETDRHAAADGVTGKGVTVEEAVTSLLDKKPIRRLSKAFGDWYAAAALAAAGPLSNYLQRRTALESLLVAQFRAAITARPEKFSPPFGPAV